MPQYIHDGPNLYLNADRTKIVPEDSPEAAFLLVAHGGTLPAADVEKWGLADTDRLDVKAKGADVQAALDIISEVGSPESEPDEEPEPESKPEPDPDAKAKPDPDNKKKSGPDNKKKSGPDNKKKSGGIENK